MSKPIDQEIADGRAKMSNPMKVKMLRSALKDLLEVCEWAEFESRDVEPHELEAIVDDTLARARLAVRIAE